MGEDTIAVTHNFCSPWNLEHVWRCTKATHPVLHKNLSRVLQAEHPELFDRMRESVTVSGDDPTVAYAEILDASHEALGTAVNSVESASSDEEYLTWSFAKARHQKN